MITDTYNLARYRPSDRAGHYESYFLRANHPSRPQAFWIRYTVFSPKGRPREAIGELWAVMFDGASRRHVAAKSEMPIDKCVFAADQFGVRVGSAVLDPGRIIGDAGAIAWDLTYTGDDPPVFDLPLVRYAGGFPKAKALVALPMARFSGQLTVEGEPLQIDRWIGSQNHNWGTRHTDRYAWGQVCGFDNAPDSFLEVVSVWQRIGPFGARLVTLLVLRHGGRACVCNRLAQAFASKAAYDYSRWTFATRDGGARVEGEITASHEAFVGLRYYNPPGGVKECLNSKIATCTLKITERGRTETLRTDNRAAFEILTDAGDHGVEMRV